MEKRAVWKEGKHCEHLLVDSELVLPQGASTRTFARSPGWWGRRENWVNMGLSGPLFRCGCFQLFTKQSLLGLESGEEETVFNFGMSQTASLPASTHASFQLWPELKAWEGPGAQSHWVAIWKDQSCTLHRSWDDTDLRGRDPSSLARNIKPGEPGWKPRILATRPPGTTGEKQKWPGLLPLFVSRTVSRRQQL